MTESQMSKIAISPTADSALSDALIRVNQDFEGGRITKTELASWILLQATSALTDSMMTEIRKVHFNQIAYLGGLVKRLRSAKRENLGPEDLATLQAMLGQQVSSKAIKPKPHFHRRKDENAETNNPNNQG